MLLRLVLLRKKSVVQQAAAVEDIEDVIPSESPSVYRFSYLVERARFYVQVIRNDIKTANDLFEYQRVAEELHDAKKYNESLRWYLRAAQIEPHPTILISIEHCY